METVAPVRSRVGGGIISALGGLIGLGGAEFRLPLLVGMFRFGALETQSTAGASVPAPGRESSLLLPRGPRFSVDVPLSLCINASSPAMGQPGRWRLRGNWTPPAN